MFDYGYNEIFLLILETFIIFHAENNAKIITILEIKN
jgi:hypothetical protein